MYSCVSDYICAYSDKKEQNQQFKDELYLLEMLEQQVIDSNYDDILKDKYIDMILCEAEAVVNDYE